MTKIEWVKNPNGTQGLSWNPIKGKKGNWICQKMSSGCKNCYAERLNFRISKISYTPGADFPRLDEKILLSPLRHKKSKTFFVCSMTDLFWGEVKTEWIDEIINIAVHIAPQHKYIFLTKRISRMEKYFRDLTPANNIILGTSVEDQVSAEERIPVLANINSWYTRFVSYEPAIGVASWYKYPNSFDWLIAGGESGNNARPSNPDNFRIARDFCQSEGIPFFFKQWGEWGSTFIPSFPGDEKPKNVQSHQFNDGSKLYRYGRKNTGNLLDGKTYNEIPYQQKG